MALPFLVRERFTANVGALGILQSMVALGAVLGVLWLERYRRLRRRGMLAYGGWLISGVALLFYGLPLPLAAVAVAALVNGAAITMFGLVWTNTLQELVPRERLGRVASIDMLGSFALLPIGTGVAGWATDLLGPSLVFVGGGALTAALIGLGLCHPAVRRLD